MAFRFDYSRPINTHKFDAPRVTDVIREVSIYYHIPAIELVSRRRTKKLVTPRQVAFYLCSKLTRASYPQIGQRFDRDHTTVLYGAGKIGTLIETDSDIRADVHNIAERLTPKQGA